MENLSGEGKKARQADVTVLVVDTDQQRCEQLGRQLADEKSHFDIRTETGLEDSVTRTETEAIDIVVASTTESGSDRLSLLRDLRATDQDTSVVLVAPSVGPDTARAVLDHGGRWLQTNGDLAAMVPVIADLIDEERTIDRGALATVEETTDRYERLTQMLPDIVFVTDYNSRMLFANDELERQTGLTVEDFQMEQESNPFIHPEDQERLAAAMGQFIESDRSISDPLDNRFIDKNGNVHWYTSRIGKVNYEGEPALQFVTQDITSRRGRGDDRSDERWYRSLLDRTQRLARIGGYEFDLQAENFLWTDGMYDLLELETKEDPDMEMLLEYIHPTDRERVQTAVESALTDGDPFDLDVKLRTEAGTLKWVRFQGDPLPAESDTVERLRGALVDITERKEYETELREREQAIERANDQLRQIIDLIPDPLFVKNLDDEILLSNEANADLLGSTPQDVEGKPEPEIMPDVENYEQYRQRDIEVIQTDEATTFEEELQDPDGETRIFKITRIPFEASGTDEDAVLGYARDVTDLKEYEQELEATKRTLEESNERLDQFASVVSHDLRNPLQVADSTLALVEETGDLDRLGDVRAQLTRMEELIDDLLTMARAGETIEETEPVALADVVSESWTHADTASAELTVTVPEDATVMADRNRLLQVFENLFRNAVDHNDPPLTVRVGLLDGPNANPDDAHQRGLFIEDDGDGIPPDERDEVFAHGYTTSDEGTGFGLSIVTDVVDAHGWDVTIAESDEAGARFEITGVEIAV